MNAETLQAMNESVAHWERMESGRRLPCESHMSESCALCQQFCIKNDSCVGCPIKDAGFDHCGPNPNGGKSHWQRCDDAYCRERRRLLCEGMEFTKGDELDEAVYNSEDFRVEAGNMALFLKSLLPKTIDKPQ